MPKQALFITNDTNITGLVSGLLAKIEIEAMLVESFAKADFVLYYQALPECIILDLSLSQSQGLDYLRKLKADERYTKIPMLVIIETPDPVLIKDAFQAGATRYLAKAFLQRSFLHTIIDILPSPAKA
ncbi:MAG: response regulator [Anaerolineae bacterium]|nr:response regulator [Anaerolineae bacterium]